MGSVTFWGPLDTSLFAQIVGARWPQKTSVFGPQNLALCEVLGSKCDKNKCGKHSGKCVKLVLRGNCRLLHRLLNNAKLERERERERDVRCCRLCHLIVIRLPSFPLATGAWASEGWSTVVKPDLRELMNTLRFRIGSEYAAVACAIQLRMRMRILTRPENSLANFGHQFWNNKLRSKCCEGIR